MATVGAGAIAALLLGAKIAAGALAGHIPAYLTPPLFIAVVVLLALVLVREVLP